MRRLPAMDELGGLMPWRVVEVVWQAAIKAQEELPLPAAIVAIAAGTAEYENELRKLWEQFKKDPTEDNANQFIAAVVEYSNELWPEVLKEVLGIDEFVQSQVELLRRELGKHHDYLRESLLPDIQKGLAEDKKDFSNMDYRVIMLYAGALWAIGHEMNVRYHGLLTRDLNERFAFVGPNDSETCEGENGCAPHVGKIYTVAEILERDIIPGHFKCLTNCRHMLVPVEQAMGELGWTA